ncbi:MAG: energy transducer TonB [Alistipes sp.]|nr:energy transducer TonB [Alistipes sp.]
MHRKISAPPAPPRRPRMRLPFEKRPTDVGSWAYEHRVGLCCMIIAYLAFGIAFVGVKIILNERPTLNTLYIDLTELQPEPQPEQETPEMQQKEDWSGVRNRVSDENGRDQSVGSMRESEASASRSKSTTDFQEQLDAEAEAVAGRVRAGRDAFEKGRREEQEMIDRNKAQREAKPGEKASGVKQAGRVLVSYWLPNRRDVSLVVPAYQCEGGGEVTIAITVNRNGRITAASVKEGSGNSCIDDTAIQAARRSQFNVDASASDRQNGTITYTFVPQ